MTRSANPSGTTPEYVGFWQRFGAFGLDSLFASLLLYPVMLLIGSMTGLNNPVGQPLPTDPEQLGHLLAQLMTRMSIELVILAGVFIGLWIYFGATPGKIVFKSYIVDANSHGPASTLQLCLRYIGYFISLLPFGLGFIWIGFDTRKQGWHDKLARTVVIKRLPDTAS